MSNELYEFLIASDDDVVWNCLYCTFNFNYTHFPFTLVDNSLLDKIIFSNSMKFCESLPNVDTIQLADDIYQGAEHDQNISYLLDSKYHSVNTFQSLNSKNSFNLFHSNVNGLESKFDNLHEFLSSSNSEMSIIALTETSQKLDHISNVTIDGYSEFFTPTKCN